jgi:hypothetical protein
MYTKNNHFIGKVPPSKQPPPIFRQGFFTLSEASWRFATQTLQPSDTSAWRSFMVLIL